MNLKHIKLSKANNGEEALTILKDKIIPDIIILDLNMPKVSGIEFLSILKADEHLKYIPAFILTTSNNRKISWNATESELRVIC
jgi:CheY-like chemotaxis protein